MLSPRAHALRSTVLLALALAVSGCPRSKGSGNDAKPAGTPPPAVVTPETPQLAVGTFTVTKEAEDDPNLVLDKVTVDATSTKLDFTFTNKGKRATNITVSPPGDKHAMFLEWENGKKARFQSATGIAIKPTDTTVGAGMTMTFSLVFDPLDPGVRKFDMYEGEDAKKLMPGQSTYWVIRKIELK